MRLPRFRLSIRSLMVVVAFIAVALGSLEGVRMKRRSDSYRRMAQRFADEMNLERAMEHASLDKVRSSIENARTLARQAFDALAGIGLEVSPNEIDPGIFGARRFPEDADRIDANHETMQQLKMTMALEAARLAKLYLDQTALDAKRVRYFANLAEKYRLAASRPWFSIEPDPPEPK